MNSRPMERPMSEAGSSSPEKAQTSLQQWFRRYAPYLFALSAMMPAPRTEAKSAAPDSQSVATVAERLPMEHHEGPEQTDRDLQWPGSSWTFFSKDSTGASHFEPSAILAPAQLEFSQVEQVTSQMDFTLPYEYSRLFDTGAPLRPEDHDKLVQFIDQELKREFVDRLHGLDLNKRVYETEHGTAAALSSLKITDIQITGTASPEGPEDMGSQTIEPGHIEEENIELAEIRTEAGVILTQEAMAKFGVPPEKLKFAVLNLRAEELQFTDGELHDLAAVADANGYSGVDDLECIYNLIVGYNDGRVTDPDAIATLDRTMASKRSVQVVVSYEGERQHVLFIPLPLLLLALLPLRRWTRNRKDQPPVSPTPEQSRPPVVPPEQVHIPDPVRSTRLPEDEPTLTDMTERTVIDDLSRFYDHPHTAERGLDYHRLTTDFDAQRYDQLQNDEDRELVLTTQILEAWKQHDRKCRELSGISEDQLDLGLDYENQPKQIQWARMHARELLGLIRQRRATENGEQEYREFLNARTKQLIQQRTFRQARPDSF